MNNLSEKLLIIGMIVFTVAVLLGIGWYFTNQGTVDRFWTGFNKDKFTAKDEVYQTGSVRVYKFTNNGTVCYLADKQSQSVAIYCK